MAIEIGTPAPDFTLRNQHGEEITLSSFRGEKNVVILFYPFTFTGVCKGELCTIRDNLSNFDNDDVVTLSISCDSVFSNKVWAEQEGYTFSSLSDFWPHGAVAQKYGVFDAGSGMAKRGTFILDSSGIVRYVVVNPRGQARAVGAYRAALSGLAGSCPSANPAARAWHDVSCQTAPAAWAARGPAPPPGPRCARGSTTFASSGPRSSPTALSSRASPFDSCAPRPAAAASSTRTARPTKISTARRRSVIGTPRSRRP